MDQSLGDVPASSAQRGEAQQRLAIGGSLAVDALERAAPARSRYAYVYAVTLDGVVQPAPAPRFSRTPGAIARPPARAGEHTDEALGDWGFGPGERAELRRAQVIGPGTSPG